MTAPLIALVGASGQVGRVAVEMLAEFGGVRLRLGGRHPDRLSAVAACLGHSVEVRPVDIDDPSALAQFCRGARVVLTCAGPSYLFKERVARAAIEAHADYVDVSGDDPAYAALAGLDLAAEGRTAVLSAGMLPGAANLVVRWAADKGFDRVFRLVAHVGGLERFTSIAAQDLVLSVFDARVGELPGDEGGRAWYGESLAAWRGGRRASRALLPVSDTELPYFPGTVSLQPYLSSGCERVGTMLALTELDWYTVSGGTRLGTVLSKLRGLPTSRRPALAAAAKELCAAAELDLAGRDPYHLMAFHLAGQREGHSVRRSVVLRTSDSYRLTSATAALAVRALLDGAIAPGVQFVDTVLDPAAFVAGLDRLGAIDYLRVVDGAPGVVEEGVL
ncbi:saccharopine dehydrogenase NADP-binding domain-containing protein [Rhodococcus sp. NPDC055112]